MGEVALGDSENVGLGNGLSKRSIARRPSQLNSHVGRINATPSAPPALQTCIINTFTDAPLYFGVLEWGPNNPPTMAVLNR